MSAASPAALGAGCFHLAGLVGAGVSLVEALEHLGAGETNRRRRALWSALADRVAGGAPLSAALAEAPGWFDAEMVGLCRAGEAEGTLAAALGAMERSFAARDEFRRRARTALTYPLFAAATLGITLVFLFGHVVPALTEDGFGASSRAQAWHAHLLLGTASAVRTGGVPTLVVGAATVLLMRIAARRQGPTSIALDGVALRALPGGRLAALLESARFARTVARLERREAALPEALAIATEAVGRPALRAELHAVRARVVGGTAFAAALGDARHVPRALARYASAGEASGGLPDALERAAHALEHDARTALERIERLVGPALLCAVGLVLLWIVVSIVLPVYDAAIGAGLGA